MEPIWNSVCGATTYVIDSDAHGFMGSVRRYGASLAQRFCVLEGFLGRRQENESRDDRIVRHTDCLGLSKAECLPDGIDFSNSTRKAIWTSRNSIASTSWNCSQTRGYVTPCLTYTTSTEMGRLMTRNGCMRRAPWLQALKSFEVSAIHSLTLSRTSDATNAD